MAKRPYPIVTISPKAEKSLVGGHPWVYGEEIKEQSEQLLDGQIVDVNSVKGKWLGSGLYNGFSKIAVRLISRNTNDVFDDNFWQRRLSYALNYRINVLSETELNCCRLVHGEADQLPGLTIDKYYDVLVAQVLCKGIDDRQDIIFTALKKVLAEKGMAVRGVYLRNDVAIRKLEGLTEMTGWYDNPTDQNTIVRIKENDLWYDVDVATGQKTGYFLDQKRNRKACGQLSRGHTVLDCFCNVGGFALNCALNGAKAVTAVDVSELALQQGAHNAQLNQITNITWQKADVFELLKQLATSHDHTYDLIILDPPAFTKARSAIANAEYGYYEINRLAMKILPKGGWLVTCSCSHFMNPSRYKAILQKAASDAGVGLRQVLASQQSPDHPILWNVPETEYLQFYMFQIV